MGGDTHGEPFPLIPRLSAGLTGDESGFRTPFFARMSAEPQIKPRSCSLGIQTKKTWMDVIKRRLGSILVGGGTSGRAKRMQTMWCQGKDLLRGDSACCHYKIVSFQFSRQNKLMVSEVPFPEK